MKQLPTTADPPLVQKFDPDGTPVLQYAISSTLPVVELTNLANKQIVQRLESVSGIGQVTISGGRLHQIQIDINPDRLRAYNLSMTDVANAIEADARNTMQAMRSAEARLEPPVRM